MFPMQGCICEILSVFTMIKLFGKGSVIAWVILGGFIIEWIMASSLKRSLAENGLQSNVSMTIALFLNFFQWGQIVLCFVGLIA